MVKGLFATQGLAHVGKIYKRNAGIICTRISRLFSAKDMYVCSMQIHI